MADSSQRGVPNINPERPEEWMVEPLDYLILKELPDHGTNVGLYQVGSTNKGIREKLGASNISSGSLATRIRFLEIAGYARKVRMVGTSGAQAFQKTDKGKEVLEKWLSRQS